jgi:hypothetical protein
MHIMGVLTEYEFDAPSGNVVVLLHILRIIQANDLALTLNVLAVCAVFVFVSAVLLGAF